MKVKQLLGAVVPLVTLLTLAACNDLTDPEPLALRPDPSQPVDENVCPPPSYGEDTSEKDCVF